MKTNRKTTPGTVYWDKDTLKEIRGLAQSIGIPMQVLVRIAMKRFLEDKENIKWLGVK